MKIEKVEKLIANFDDKTEYDIHIKSFNHRSVLEKLLRIIKSKQRLD